jgi:hypothetical protein
LFIPAQIVNTDPPALRPGAPVAKMRPQPSAADYRHWRVSALSERPW